MSGSVTELKNDVIPKASAARRGQRTVRMQVLHGSQGRQHDGNSQGLPEQTRGGVDVLYISQDPWTEGEAIQGQPVAADRRFGFGATDKVVP